MYTLGCTTRKNELLTTGCSGSRKRRAPTDPGVGIKNMKSRIISIAILIIFLTFQLSWADADPWTKENETFAQEYLEKLRQEKPEIFRDGNLLSKKFINAQFAEKYGNYGNDVNGWLQYNFEYHFSSGWCIAKVFIFKHKHEEGSVRYEIYRTSKSVNGYNFEFSGDEEIITEGSYKYFVKTYEDGEVRRAFIRDELDTKMGKLSVVAKEYSDKTGAGMASTLVLNYKEIFKSETDNIHLYGVFDISDKPHILIGENCGGTGCRYDDLSLLILNVNGEVKKIRTDDFYSEDNSIKANLKGNDIIIDLGLYKGKKKTAVYSNNKLNILYKKLPYKPLTSEECADLYKIAKECVRLRELFGFSKCDESAINFDGMSNASAWTLRYISNEPGFNQKLFDAECLNACKTGNLSGYNVFAERLCGRKAP